MSYAGFACPWTDRFPVSPYLVDARDRSRDPARPLAQTGGPMRKSDDQLQRDVTEELRWDPSIGRAEIGVVARDGVVSLTGQVDSFAKRWAALKAAERVSGVT